MYVRSLVADIARSVKSCATTVELKRVQQGDFKLEAALDETDWTVDGIRRAIEENERNNPSVIKLASNST